ncbi:MAG: hypothetical protein ABI144_05640 [Gallionella sp.]
MGHEISQFDIHDHQLRSGKLQPKVVIVTDLGEAKITRTIFGRARIRVVREQDKKRRAWLLAILLVTVTAVAVRQGWIIFQTQEYVAPPVPLSERIQVSAPVFQPAHIAPDPHPSTRKSESLIQTEIDGLLSGPLPRHPPGWKPPVKPDTAEPAMANQAEVQDSAQDSVHDSVQAPAKAIVKVQATAAQPQTTPQTVITAAVPIANLRVKRDASIPVPAVSVPHPISAQD